MDFGFHVTKNCYIDVFQTKLVRSWLLWIHDLLFILTYGIALLGSKVHCWVHLANLSSMTTLSSFLWQCYRIWNLFFSKRVLMTKGFGLSLSRMLKYLNIQAGSIVSTGNDASNTTTTQIYTHSSLIFLIGDGFSLNSGHRLHFNMLRTLCLLKEEFLFSYCKS
jgi:hypothetical protein